MSFEKLMGELEGLSTEQETMSKALPADDGKDDENIQAAAAEGGAMGGEGGEGGEGVKPAVEGKKDGEGEEPMGKSLGAVTLPDGTQVEAVDGTELVKSLMGEIGALKEKHAASEGSMLKALEQCVGLIKGQNDLIKSLQGTVTKLSGEGRGRKTVLSVVEKPVAGEQTLAKSESGVTAKDFMAKSEAAWKGGKISGAEFTTIDVTLRQGQKLDAALIQKVLS